MSDRPRIAAIVLAAGRSMRMGKTNKLLADFDGRVMIERTLNEVVAAGVDGIVVVTGHQPNELRDALKLFDVRFLHNQNYREGLSTSLKVGVQGLKVNVDGVLVVLGDMPLVEAATFRQIMDHFNRTGDICVPVYQGKQGNPVLWGREFFAEILMLEGDRGAKGLLNTHQGQVISINVKTSAVLRDFDVPSDLPSF